MRDPKRIKPFIESLQLLWGTYPDWRFGQLVENIEGHLKSFRDDSFYAEEEEWADAMNALLGED